jgi:tetratricopeptide (TPR) repeat protein
VVPVLDDQGRAVDIKKDENGAAVRSRLDADLLRTLARRTGGSYFEAARPGGELPRLLASLTRLARAAHGSRLIEQPVARFPFFAGLATLLLALELTLPRRRGRKGGAGEAPAPERARDLKAAAAAVLIAPLAALTLLPSSAHAQSAWAKGDRAFQAQRYAEAESLYSLRLRRRAPDDVRVNRATARALRGETETGIPELEHLAKGEKRSGLAAGYNLGTVQGGQKQYAPALQALRQVLEKDPNDQDARWNYEVLAHRQEMEKQKKNQPPQQKQSGGGGGQQNQNPQPSPSNQMPQAPQPQAGNQQQEQQPSGGSTMDRAQAERLLGALEEMERAEQERQRRVSVKRDKRGKDW